MLNRIIGVLRLDANTFEEIEHDESATTQAAIVVGLAGLLSGIGGAVAAASATDALQNVDQLEDLGIDTDGLVGSLLQTAEVSPAGSFVSALVGAFVMWLVWSWVTMFVGTRFFQADADLGEMLRVIGFSQAPGFVGILAAIPGVNCLVCLLSPLIFVWSIACSFIGLRQGLDLDNTKTFLVAVISFIPAVIINSILESVIRGIF